MLLDLGEICGLLDLDPPSCRLTVGAGMPVADLYDHVFEQGWSLPNIGVIKAQTVAGLLATASHGRCVARARRLRPAHFPRQCCPVILV